MLAISRNVAALGLLVLLAACVVERQPPAVSISGGRLYPPREFLGRWQSADQELIFRPPPAPALERRQGSQSLVFDIVSMRRRSDGAWLLQLNPAGEGGVPEERILELDAGALRELRTDDLPRRWTRAPDE
ncbi:MAG: hypothetical protein K1X75_03650 [Leptospirales bacterium]|nr:hypothetical protein [Leptospirales bacterium]